MKEKVIVTYSVQYCKEVELEVNEEIKKLLDEGKVIDWNKYDNYYSQILDLNNQFELELPIPDLFSYDGKFGKEFEKVEYVDGSFDIETFEKQS